MPTVPRVCLRDPVKKAIFSLREKERADDLAMGPAHGLACNREHHLLFGKLDCRLAGVPVLSEIFEWMGILLLAVALIATKRRKSQHS